MKEGEGMVYQEEYDSRVFFYCLTNHRLQFGCYNGDRKHCPSSLKCKAPDVNFNKELENQIQSEEGKKYEYTN